MQHTIQQQHAHQYTLNHETKASSFSFIGWCEGQQSRSLFWLATIMLVQSCIMVPITFFMLSHSDMSFIFWVLPSVAIVMCLVTNLATLPMKVNIPVFFLSIAVDLLVILSCLGSVSFS